MPLILLQRIPLPSLKTYTAVSVALLACAVYYAHNDAQLAVSAEHSRPQSEDKPQESEAETTSSKTVYYLHGPKFDKVVPEPDYDEINFTEVLFPSFNKNNSDSEANTYGVRMAAVLLGETWCIWSLVNMACCCLILLGRGLQKIVFGNLRVSEQQHFRDKFWNFAFYKFIFIFGVMNVQNMEEVVLWSTWFAVLACLHLLAQLCKDRFEYLSFSPATPTRTHIKVVLLLVGIQMTCCALFAACIFIGYFFVGLNIFAFMAAEVILLMTKTCYVLVRYGIHLYDLHCDRVWENRAVYIYYSELVFELTAISADFCNHLHMLVWSNIFLSMASLVICMQLRFLFHELQRRIKRHKNYRRVVNTMDEKFGMATSEELEQNNTECAICWEKMENARKLPCGHFFHNACLRSWLEQDTSCPICRNSLSDLQPPSQAQPGPQQGAGDGAQGPNMNDRPTVAQNMMTNHFFHFDASRYVSWLPSFSVEVSHTQILGNRTRAQQLQMTSQLDNMARQVQEVFPNMPLTTIQSDIQVTRSVEVTIENIVEGRLVAPPNFPRTGLQDSESDSSGSESDSNTSTASSGSHGIPAASHSGTEGVSGGLYDALAPFPVSPLSFIIDESLPDLGSSPDDAPVHSVKRTEVQELPNISGGRFSKSPVERETMLLVRKETMLEQARRKFLEKETQSSDNQPMSDGVSSSAAYTQSDLSQPPAMGESCIDPNSAANLMNLESGTSQEMDNIALRRELAFMAAQRRMQRD